MRRRLPRPLAFGRLAAVAVCAGIGYVAWAIFIGPPPGVGPKADESYQAQHAAYS